jgi:serine/threonine-protein kinase
MFDLRALLVIAPDVEMVAGASLSEAARHRLGCGVTDLLLSKLRSRSRSKIIAGEAIGFVRCFESPTRLTAAVRQAATATGRPAPDVLASLFPLIAGLVNDGFLVAMSELPAATRTPQFGAGRTVAGFEIVRCLQMYEDTELYQVRADGRLAAMKVARSTTAGVDIDREAEIHRRLGGETAPPLLAHGKIDGHAFFVIEWRPGRDAAAAADAIRASSDDPRAALCDLCVHILEAFAALHRRGLVHGDVHPNNIIVGDDGAITVLDYGLARFVGASHGIARPVRGGVGFFLDPAYAIARLAGRAPPPANARSDQYSLACLVYFLIAQRPYLDFSFDEATALGQIRDLTPRSFADSKAEPWPELETVLAIALHKKPSRRFASLSAFADALKGCDLKLGAGAPAALKSKNDGAGASLDLLVSDTLTRLVPGSWSVGNYAAETSNASAHSGASGIAYALYRIACARDDPDLLAAADLWSCRAMARRDDPDAYFDAAEDVTPNNVGRISLVHSATGTAYVHALIAMCAGNALAAQRAIDTFVRAGDSRSDNPDLFLGRAGLLVACAGLLGAAGTADGGLRTTEITDMGRRLAAEIGQEVATRPPIGRGPCVAIGVAHGWSGMIYALLRWSEADGGPVIDSIEMRLDQLAACARPHADGMRWPIRIGGDADDSHMPGWCNGGAGHVHTYLLAFERFGRQDFLDLAVRSASQAIVDGRGGAPFLCCGMTGIAYAALALYRISHELRWRDAALHCAEAAMSDIRSPRLPWASLFRGMVGTALLAAELACPDEAVMPMFGRQY